MQPSRVVLTPRKFLPLLQPARYKGLHGGRGSGKSHFFAELLVETACLREGLRWACLREIQQSLDKSVKQLIEDKIKQLNLGAYFEIKSDHIRTRGGGVITFHGMQNHTADSFKSLEGYDGAWFEEAQTMSQRSLDILTPTIRKDYPDGTTSELWFSWNPERPTDPIDVLLRGDSPPENRIVVEANYRDNPFLPNVLRLEAEDLARRDPEKYRHVWLGQYLTRSTAVVFKNWTIGKLQPPPTARRLYGADWGFSVDPTVAVRLWVWDRTVYIDREVHAVGCEIDRTPALFDTLDGGEMRKWVCTADSARPETISYMQSHGYRRIKPARKGSGSVEEGVAFLQSFDIVVHPSCTHTIDELSMYSYKVDPKTGHVLPVLEDRKNHVIDAARYALEDLRRGGYTLDDMRRAFA